MSNLTPDTSVALFKASQAATAKSAANVKAAKDTREITKATEAAQEFEAMFVAEMMKPMFEGISTEAPFGGGKGEEVFRGILIQEYGKLMAQTGKIGLSTQIRDEMIRMQAQASQSQTAIMENLK